MRFYTTTHRHYCGVDLHARSMYVCILGTEEEKLAHRKIPAEPAAFLDIIKPYRDDLVVAVECLFCWYWLADLCAKEKIHFVLGHAFYMKAIHGGKSKNDRIDSYKIAALLRGKNLPQAYVYPRHMRATRDLLRRRSFFARKRGELLAHFENTRTQNNLEPFHRRISKSRERGALLEHFEEGDVQMSPAANLSLLEAYDETITELELHLVSRAQHRKSERALGGPRPGREGH